MRRFILASSLGLLSLLIIFLFVGNNYVATQEESISNDEDEYVPNEVLVKFEKSTSKYFIQEAIKSVQGKIITFRKEEINPLEWEPHSFSHRFSRCRNYR